jgi:flagellar hook-basal body complex protein FliE
MKKGPIMDVNATLASQLYNKAQVAARPEPRQSGAGSAGEVFQATAEDFMQTLRAGEETVKAGLAGRADPQAVVEAMAATELAVQTAVAVREKVVEAYQEILRMPV